VEEKREKLVKKEEVKAALKAEKESDEGKDVKSSVEKQIADSVAKDLDAETIHVWSDHSLS